MCLTCEGLLYEEHQQLLMNPKGEKCPHCHKFLNAGDQGCYHCFAVGNTIDECPECSGKPWSPEILEISSQGLPRA